MGDGQSVALVQQGQNIDLQVSSPTQYTINTSTLASYVGVHPRLFFNASGTGSVSDLQNTITTNASGTRWGKLWSSFKNYADYAAVQPPPAYTTAGGNDEQVWERPVGDALAILAMAYQMTEPASPSPDTVWFEAEEAPINSPMTITGSVSAASGGAYISTPSTASNATYNLQPPSASYYFSTQTTLAYYVWTRVFAPTSTENTWFLNIDGQTSATQTNYNSNPANRFNVSTTTVGSWTWVKTGPFYPTPGNHVLNLTYEAGGVEFDKFVITSDTSVAPSGLGTEQHWLEAKNFQQNANGSGSHLYNLPVTTTDTLAPFGDEISASHKWLETWGGDAGTNTQPVSTATPDAQQTFVANGGSYDIWLRMKGPFKGHANVWFELDNDGYNSATIESSGLTFPYNTLIPVTQVAYNSTLTAPYNSYPYREWIWVEVKAGASFGTGQSSHVLKLINENSNGNAACAIDRFLVQAAGSPTPTDPNKYLSAAAQWANAAIYYPKWGDGSTTGKSLAAAHMLIGLGLLYDWCYSNLSSTDLAAVGSKLSTQAAVMNGGASTMWWKNSSLDNIYIECCTSLNMAGLAIYGDGLSGASNTTDQSWLQTALTKLSATMTDVGSDGAWHEGGGYFGYALQHMLEYMDTSKKMLGVDMFSTPWIEQAATYRLYFDLPANQQIGGVQTHVMFADDVGFDWYGPDYQLRKLASQYDIPTAQWQAGWYDDKNLNSWSNAATEQGTSPWLNLFWYNSSVPETAPKIAGPGGTSFPSLAFFSDLDFVISRSNWSGDESVLAYQCGPPIGHDVQAKDHPFVDWGTNHVHPAVSSFCLFALGNYLIQDAGYDSGNNKGNDPYKLTSQENTLEVNNAGQLGEAANITFNGTATQTEDSGGVFNPAIDDSLSFSSTAMDYIVGNAAGAYPTTANLTKYERHLLHLKASNVLVVVDDVALSSSALPLMLNFYPQNVAPTPLSPNSYSTTSSNGTQLDFSLMTPSNSAIAAANVTWQDGAGTHYCYQVTPPGGSASTWSNAVALAWSPSGSTPNGVTMIADPDQTAWKFKVGNETMVLDRNVTSYAPDEKARAVTTIEAESVTPAAPMQTALNPTASQNGYILAPAGATPNLPTDTLSSPSATYTFNVPDTGVYAVWARVQAADLNSNSFWFALNPGTGAYTNLASAPTYGTWVWVKLTSAASLTSGSNTLGLKYGSANCWIDQIIVTDDLQYTPTYVY